MLRVNIVAYLCGTLIHYIIPIETGQCSEHQQECPENILEIVLLVYHVLERYLAELIHAYNAKDQHKQYQKYNNTKY